MHRRTETRCRNATVDAMHCVHSIWCREETSEATHHRRASIIGSVKSRAPAKLGEALASFNNGWGADEAFVVGREMERLHRLAYRVVWVNPRLQNPQFQPLVGAMAAALPFVDSFVSGHSFIAMQRVADAIALVER
jgi:uncharacterized protein with von Willebrand factor type A (vWA) domain